MEIEITIGAMVKLITGEVFFARIAECIVIHCIVVELQGMVVVAEMSDFIKFREIDEAYGRMKNQC